MVCLCSCLCLICWNLLCALCGCCTHLQALAGAAQSPVPTALDCCLDPSPPRRLTASTPLPEASGLPSTASQAAADAVSGSLSTQREPTPPAALSKSSPLPPALPLPQHHPFHFGSVKKGDAFDSPSRSGPVLLPPASRISPSQKSSSLTREMPGGTQILPLPAAGESPFIGPRKGARAPRPLVRQSMSTEKWRSNVAGMLPPSPSSTASQAHASQPTRETAPLGSPLEAPDTGETRASNGTMDKEPLCIDDMSDDDAGAEYLLSGLKTDSWGADMADACLGQVSRSPDSDSECVAAHGGSSVCRSVIQPLSKVSDPARPTLQDKDACARLGSLSPDENARSNGHGEK
jgi:hypothetical protein